LATTKQEKNLHIFRHFEKKQSSELSTFSQKQNAAGLVATQNNNK
jgi:hypothetical protein